MIFKQWNVGKTFKCCFLMNIYLRQFYLRQILKALLKEPAKKASTRKMESVNFDAKQNHQLWYIIHILNYASECTSSLGCWLISLRKELKVAGWQLTVWHVWNLCTSSRKNVKHFEAKCPNCSFFKKSQLFHLLLFSFRFLKMFNSLISLICSLQLQSIKHKLH